MQRYLLCTLFLVSILSPAVAGGPFILSKGKGRVNVYGGRASANNYYNIDGNLKLFDSLRTSFTATTFGFTFDYCLLDHLALNVDVPIGYYQISSDSRFPARSIFSAVYYGLGANYQILNQGIYLSISSMLKIPPGFHHGIYDDPKHPSFLSDGYFQLASAVNIGYLQEGNRLQAIIGYNWRDEEPLDEIFYNIEAGLSKVEGTGIFVTGFGVISTGDVTQPLRPFYAGASGSLAEQFRRGGGTGRFSHIDREDYFALGAGAYLNVTPEIAISGRYAVRLFGANSLSLQGGSLGATYSF